MDDRRRSSSESVDAGFKCLSSEASGSSGGTNSGSGSSEDVTAGGAGGFFGVSSSHPSVTKALLIDPLGPASAAPAVVSRALHGAQPLSGIINPFEIVANAGYGSDLGRLDRSPFSNISRAMQHSDAAWGDEAGPAAAQLPSARAATAGLLPAPGSTVMVVRGGDSGFQRGLTVTKLPAVVPQSPFAAVPPSRVLGSAEATSADGAQPRPRSGAASVPSQPGASVGGSAGAAEPAQPASGRADSHAASASDSQHDPADTPTPEQAAPAGDQPRSQPRRRPQPPRNPFADVRGACSNPADSGAAGVAGSASQHRQPTATGELPALGAPDADWAWPVHRPDEAPQPIASGSVLPVDSPFGAVGSGAALAAQRRGARFSTPDPVSSH